MTSIEEQIAAVEGEIATRVRIIRMGTPELKESFQVVWHAARERELKVWNDLLSTIQRHKQALVVVEATNDYFANERGDLELQYRVTEALAAFNATNTGEGGR